MKTFSTAKIRNVVLLGHSGCGKTTLAEALLFTAGAIPRVGRVEDGTTVCDFDPESVRRHLSISLALAPFEFARHKINLIDTPGYSDFVTDVAAALRVADLAVFVVSAVDGVEVQTEIGWRLADEFEIPRIVFVNKLDRERASFERTLDDLKDRFGAGIAPLELPIGSEAEFRGVVDLLSDTAETYADGSPRGVEGPVPDSMAAEEHSVHDALIEGIVVADDDLTERYLVEEPIEVAELGHALATGIDAATVFPVLCGSATKLIGIDRLARFIVEDGPEPHVAGDDQNAAVFVFKTLVDPYVGRVNLFKVLQGVVQTDATLVNGRTMHDERFHQLSTMRGNETSPTSELHAGDIGAVAKLADTRTGDVIAVRGTDISVPPLVPPAPLLSIAIQARSKTDDDKLATALHRVVDEDLALRVERDAETHQTLLAGMGETHLAITIDKLARKFGVEVETEPVRVAYRETITGTAETEGRVKKQTGGHGQFAFVSLRVEPVERGDGFEFVDRVVGGAIPRNYIPAVEKGLVETIEHGGVFGFPVVDIRATVLDGKHHAVDSSELAFKSAAAHGLRAALEQANPILLEPISKLVVTVPEASQGDIMGDLNAKRGRIHGTRAIGRGEVEIVAMVPTSEILRYTIDLRSMTGGRGRFVATHSHYDPLPNHLVGSVRR